VRVVRLQNIRDGEFDGKDSTFVSQSYYDEVIGGHDVLAQDLLVAGLGDDNHPVGRACVAPAQLGPAMVKADCFRFRLNERRAIPRFVALQLTAAAKFDAAVFTAGATRSRISLNEAASRRLALPPRAEQEAILAELDNYLERSHALIAELVRGIALLREMRSALIVAVVTGKKDVRGLVPILQEAA
jgi:type I restriction enzyme S subunit